MIFTSQVLVSPICASFALDRPLFVFRKAGPRNDTNQHETTTEAREIKVYRHLRMRPSLPWVNTNESSGSFSFASRSVSFIVCSLIDPEYTAGSLESSSLFLTGPPRSRAKVPFQLNSPFASIVNGPSIVPCAQSNSIFAE